MAMMTVESHIRYLAGAYRGQKLEFDSLILDADAKRVHVGHVVRHGDTELATFECMLLHYDVKAGRTAPFPEAVQQRLAALVVAPKPDWSGRAVAIVRKG